MQEKAYTSPIIYSSEIYFNTWMFVGPLYVLWFSIKQLSGKETGISLGLVQQIFLNLIRG